jgi:hypothetical protein
MVSLSNHERTAVLVSPKMDTIVPVARHFSDLGDSDAPLKRCRNFRAIGDPVTEINNRG